MWCTYFFCGALPLEVVVVGDPGEGLAHRQPAARLGLVVGGLARGGGEVGARHGVARQRPRPRHRHRALAGLQCCGTELKQMKFRTINAGCQHQTAAVIHKQPRVHFAVFLFRVALLPLLPPSTLLLLLVSLSWLLSAPVCGCLTSPDTLHINTSQHTDWMGVSCLKVCLVTHIAGKINLHYQLLFSHKLTHSDLYLVSKLVLGKGPLNSIILILLRLCKIFSALFLFYSQVISWCRRFNFLHFGFR